MLPIVLDCERLQIALVGEGEETLGRLALLARHGARPAAVFAPAPAPALAAAAGPALRPVWPTAGELEAFDLVFAGDLEPEFEAELSRRARAARVLLNIEDRRSHCDFHVPAAVRRGALLLTVSTGGASPGLARRLADELARQFGPEWAERVEELGRARERWRAEGLALKALSERTNHYLAEKGWLS